MLTLHSTKVIRIIHITMNKGCLLITSLRVVLFYAMSSAIERKLTTFRICPAKNEMAPSPKNTRLIVEYLSFSSWVEFGKSPLMSKKISPNEPTKIAIIIVQICLWHERIDHNSAIMIQRGIGLAHLRKLSRLSLSPIRYKIEKRRKHTSKAM